MRGRVAWLLLSFAGLGCAESLASPTSPPVALPVPGAAGAGAAQDKPVPLASNSEPASQPPLRPSPTMPTEAVDLEPLGSQTRKWRVEESRPLRLEALSPSGSWLAYCVGESELYLAHASAKGALPRRIDQVLAWSGSGDQLVVREGNRAILLDLARATELDLSAFDPDLEDDALPDHRSFALSPRGELLAVLSRGPEPRVHLIDLRPTSSGGRSVAVGESPWRIELNESFLVLDGKAPWPVPKAAGNQLRCKSSRTHFAAYAKLSEPLARFKRSVRLVNLATLAAPEDAPGFVMPLREKWVRREGNGRLLLVSGRVQKQIASSRCGGRIRHADPKRDQFIVTCEHLVPEPSEPARAKGKSKAPQAKVETRFEAFLLAPGYVKELGLSLPRVGFDRGAEVFDGSRFVPLGEGQNWTLVDLERRALVPIPPGTRILSSDQTRALALAGSSLRSFDGSTFPSSRAPALATDIDPLSPVRIRGAFVAVGDLVFHPSSSPSLAPQTLVELTSAGATLSATAQDTDGNLRGPLVIRKSSAPEP